MIAVPEIEQIIILLLRYGTRVGRLSPRSPHQYERTHLIGLLRRVLERNNPSDYLAMSTILENSTEANISRGCWQYAAEVALRLDKNGDSKKPGHRKMCLLLGIFGSDVGYAFDDSRLCSIVKQLIKTSHPENMSCLFYLGGRNIELRLRDYFPSVVRTSSGVFTREAMLALALTHSKKSALPLVSQLLADNDIDVTGRLHCLSTKPTLLHLACSNGDWGSAGLLITRGCSANAVNGCLLTPLAEAAAGGYKKLVEALMDCTSADPHESFRCPSETTRSLQEQFAVPDDFLRPPPGTRIAQFVVRELIKLQGAPLGFADTDTSNQHSMDPSLPKKGARNRYTPHLFGFSALETVSCVYLQVVLTVPATNLLYTYLGLSRGTHRCRKSNSQTSPPCKASSFPSPKGLHARKAVLQLPNRRRHERTLGDDAHLAHPRSGPQPWHPPWLSRPDALPHLRGGACAHSPVIQHRSRDSCYRGAHTPRLRGSAAIPTRYAPPTTTLRQKDSENRQCYCAPEAQRGKGGIRQFCL